MKLTFHFVIRVN